MTDISTILDKLNLVNYKFNEEENTFISTTDDVHRVIELVNIDIELDKNAIAHEIDENSNIHLNLSE